jgi:ketosteroid isomerase-like protein
MAATLEALAERLELLEAERAIMQTLYAYGNAIDYGNQDEYRECWLDDAVLHWPTYAEPLRGHAAIMDAFRAHTHAPDVYHKHFVLDPRIEISGDTADVESYYARLDDREGGPYIRSFGRYLDVLQRGDDGRWRFRERRAQAESRLLSPVMA